MTRPPSFRSLSKDYTCTVCGKKVRRKNSAELLRPWSGACNSCKSSARIKKNCLSPVGKPYNWYGSYHIRGSQIELWKKRAENQGIDYLLGNNGLDHTWDQQKGQCFLFQKPLGRGRIGLIRLDKDLPYVYGNVAFLCPDAYELYTKMCMIEEGRPRIDAIRSIVNNASKVK